MGNLLMMISVLEMCIVASEGLCPTGTRKTQDSAPANCFTYHEDRLTFEGANQRCQESGSILTTITNLNHLETISSVLNMSYLQLWSGVRISSESDFKNSHLSLDNIFFENSSNKSIDFGMKPNLSNSLESNISNNSCIEIVKSLRTVNLTLRYCNEVLPFVCEHMKRENFIFNNVPDLPESVITVLDYAAIAIGVCIGVVLVTVLILDFFRKVRKLKTVDVTNISNNNVEMKSTSTHLTPSRV